MVLLTLFEILFYSLACISLGLIILHWLKNSESPSITRWAFAFILGGCTLASIWLILALLGWFYTVVIGLLLFVLILAGLPFLYKEIFALLGHFRLLWQELRAEPWVWQGIALAAVVFCLYFVTTLGSGLTGDSMAFYMMIPKLTAASHHLTFGPSEDIAAAFGLQGELHYAALLSLGNLDAARLFDWPILLAGAVMMSAVSAKVGVGRRGQLIALIMFLTSFAVLHFTGQGKVDRFAIGLALAAVYWAMQTGFSSLTGYLTGMAVIAKLIYLPFFVPIVIFLSLWKHVQPYDVSVKTVFRTLFDRKLLLAFGMGVFLALLPFLIKTAYLPSLLEYDEARMELIKNPDPDTAIAMGLIPFSDMLRFYFRFPFDVTFMLYESVSPLILAFIPLVLFLPRNSLAKFTPLWNITMAAIVGTTIWMFLYPNFTHPLSMYYGRGLRYYLPSVLLFIPIAARAAEYAAAQHLNSSRFLRGIIAGSVLLTLLTTMMRYTNNQVFFPVNTYKYLLQEISECDLPHEPNYCAVMKELNRTAPAGARVLTSSTVYWLRPDLIECAYDILYTPTFEQSDDMWFWIRKNGFDYMIVNEFDPKSVDLVSSSPPDGFTVVSLFKDGPNTVYKLNYSDAAGEPEKVCRQVAPAVWSVIER